MCHQCGNGRISGRAPAHAQQGYSMIEHRNREYHRLFTIWQPSAFWVCIAACTVSVRWVAWVLMFDARFYLRLLTGQSLL